MSITEEMIRKIKATYEANHEDLVDLEARYENGEPIDEYDITPSNTFEQGYENGIERVCAILGISLA